MKVKKLDSDLLRGPVFSHALIREGSEVIEIIPRSLKAMRREIRQNRTVAYLVVSAFFLITSFSVFLFSLPNETVSAGANTSSFSSPISSNSPTSQNGLKAVAKIPTKGMNIANNGLIMLRGGQITEIKGTTLKIKLAFEANSFTWIVETNARTFETRDFGTKFLNHEGQKISIKNFSIGDYVSISGILTESKEGATLLADDVRKIR